jgi:hypothetical protein
MSNIRNVKYIVYKKRIYVVKVGPVYIWSTAAAIKENCVHKAIEHFKVKSENYLKYKGAEIISLYVKEIKIQDNSGNT